LERETGIKELHIKIFLYLIYAVGITGHLIEFMVPLMLTLTPYTLFITGAAAFYFGFAEGRNKFLIWSLITFAATFALEAIGVYTGLIFGSYSYGEVLGLKLLGVPLIIGFNWVLIITGAITIAERIDQNIYLTALLAGTLSVLFDVFLEPVAVKLGYWTWNEGRIPLQNYYAWFIIAFLASLLYDKMEIEINTTLLEHYFFIQLLFFVLLSAFMI
jgi:bisanhydrobacterioruberin hydratase